MGVTLTLSRPRTEQLGSDAARRWLYDVAESSRAKRELLGGKGANLAEMTRLLGQKRVPPGFTITTDACVEYMRLGHERAGLAEEVDAALERLEQTSGRRFGEPGDPLLLSVRSSARGVTVDAASRKLAIDGRVFRDGEQAGDPDSVAFLHAAGLDYVSCSPLRVQIATVAAAQAAIADR